MTKFQGNIANLRIYDKALSLEELKRDAQVDEAIATKFIAANPLEFNLYNEADEQALYITEDNQLHPFILELNNASPRDITFQTPATAGLRTDYTWATWQASAELYHLQLRFRPGTLSETTKKWFKNPALRLLALSRGWDVQYDADDKNSIDWISVLWVGQEGTKLVEEIFQPIQQPRAANNTQPIQPKQHSQITSPLKAIYKNFNDPPTQNYEQRLRTIKADLDRIKADPSLKSLFNKLAAESATLQAPMLSKSTVYKLVIPHLSAVAAGGARGTRIYLNYQHLLYEDKEQIPTGSRSQFINIINHQGKEYIPLHVGFVGSNKIVNDGVISNELILRMTNISRSQSIKFETRSNSQASKFTISFDIGDTNWALAQTSQTNGISVSIESKDLTSPPDQTDHWESTTNSQGEQLRWSFTYIGSKPATLEPGASIDFKCSQIKSTAPSGLTNLYLDYEDIPGYWDGRFVCLIEKAPLVYRKRDGQERVGIGTDEPQAKLHVKQNDSTKQAACFEGGNVEIRGGKLDVTGTGTSNFAGNVNADGNLTVKGRIQDKTGSVMPVGSVLPYAGGSAPPGWLLCDGRFYSTEQYSELFDAIGYTFGSFDYSIDEHRIPIYQFAVPDLRGRFLVGVDQNSTYTLGATGGEDFVRLTTEQMPSHNHSGAGTYVDVKNTDTFHIHQAIHNIVRVNVHQGGDVSVISGATNFASRTGGTSQPHSWEAKITSEHTHGASISIANSGGNQPHENRPPFLALNYIIKY